MWAALDDPGLRLATPEFEDALDTAPSLDALLYGTIFDSPETLPQPETSWFSMNSSQSITITDSG
jgi:hypothetical protein